MIDHWLHQRVTGTHHDSEGYVLARLPDRHSPDGWLLKVAWDAASLDEALARPERDLSDEWTTALIVSVFD